MVDVIESDHKMKEGFLHIDVLHWEISLLELNLVEEKGMFKEKNPLVEYLDTAVCYIDTIW